MGKTKLKKPTREQKVHISADGKNPKDFLVIKKTDTELILARRSDGAVVKVPKKPKEVRRKCKSKT